MTIKVTTIQNGYDRYTFIKSDNGKCKIEYQHCYATGASMSHRYVTKEEGNEFYKEMMQKGFARFRDVHEVSWYATIDNNTPYGEKWDVVEGVLIPVRSRVLE